MNVKFNQKHPVIVSVLWAILLLAFYFAGGFSAAVTKASATNAMLIRAVCVFAACMLAVIYIKRCKHSFSEFGFNGLTKTGFKKVIFFTDNRNESHSFFCGIPG